jgi:ribosomal protein S16
MGYVQTLWNDPVQIKEKGKTLSAVLDYEGISLAQVTKAESDRSHREAEFAKAVGNYAPRYREGEIVAVTEPTLEYRRNGAVMGPAPRVHKLDQKAAAIFIAELDKPRQVKGIDATKQALNERAQQRAADRAAKRLENATNIKDFSRIVAKGGRGSVRVGKAATRIVGKTLDVVSDAFASLFAPTLTPEQIRQGEIATHRREAEAECSIDFARYTADLAQQRQQQENDREAERQRHRDGGGRER